MNSSEPNILCAVVIKFMDAFMEVRDSQNRPAMSSEIQLLFLLLTVIF